MFQINNLIKIILTLTHITFLISCHTTVVKPPQHPVKFEKAVSILANDLLKQIENEQNLLDFGNNKFILLEPFNEAFHGDIIKSSKKIEEIIIAEGKKNFSQFTINKMESQQLDNANYLISGIVHYQLYKDEEFFRNIQASVIDLKKSTVVANSKVWISKDETGSEPALDRIMDMREASDVKHIKRATSPPGTPISLPNNYLKIKALLSEATTAYLAQDYNHAFYLFNRATQGNDEQLMEAYAGVYQSSMALGEQDKASEAYRK
ncbi:MAG: hypothetical protein SVR94_01730, partial [Pseudomonadota bacterium]|nr:hypothetical protein [Pseudomonadota bacterium]